MADLMSNSKIKREHLIRKAFNYLRQSTPRQLVENAESTRRQYALKDKLVQLGWDESRIEVIDRDLGQSGSGSEDRHGFQYLVSEVSLGRAGIIAGIEVSRLSRSSGDWNRLLQICALADTLIMDEDGIYNVNDFNDRLLLGLKGTLSEAELHYLKARMRGGLLNKAKRGELMRPLAIGYIYDDNGQIVKDPDAQVQEAIALLFNTFKRAGSAKGVVREYTEQGYSFPHRQHKGFKLGDLTWKKLTNQQTLQTLSNPVYAGIYAYGIRQVQHTLDGTKVKLVPREQYHTWLTGSHPSYISESDFEENNRQLAQNSPPRRETGHGGAVREGSALLQGIALCGICGRKMTLRYSRAKHCTQPIYQCMHEFHNHGGAQCQNVYGGNIDRAVGNLLLEAINPMTTDAAISIQHEMSERKEEILQLYGQQMERARYEMESAKRRYLRVDPDNRLVASELEYDWNQKISEHESAKSAYEDKCAAEVRAVDEKLRAALDRLVKDFPSIWNDPETSHKEKKRIARLILEDVTITSDTSKVVLGIRFKGGSTKVLEMPNTSYNLDKEQMEMDAAAEISVLIESGLGNQEIAETLNSKGYTTKSHGRPYNKGTIAWFIQKYGLAKRRPVAVSGGWMTGREMMAKFGINEHNLRRLRESGELEFKECHTNGITYLYKPGQSLPAHRQKKPPLGDVSIPY